MPPPKPFPFQPKHQACVLTSSTSHLAPSGDFRRTCHHDRLKAGETILIQGGAGGVAGFGIQLAKHLGATVITTASIAITPMCAVSVPTG
jgi:NADPH:quinone reductase-like Zn-dependent oxidoreductase